MRRSIKDEPWLLCWLLENNKHGEIRDVVKSGNEIICAVFRYKLPKFLFREMTIKGSSDRDSAQRRRDALRIAKLAKQIVELLELTSAGQKIRDETNHFIGQKSLLCLAAVANEEAIAHPKSGRKHSEEVESRRDLVAQIKTACERLGIYTGTGETGLFANFVRDIFTHCGAEVSTVSNYTRVVKKKA